MPQSELSIGDYVLATKYSDGDPGDAFAVGFYDGMHGTNDRHFVKDSAGNQIRIGGFRKAGKIRADVGSWLISVAAPYLESSPAGTVNLWNMLNEGAFKEEEDDKV